jgi:cell division transport system permease protein
MNLFLREINGVNNMENRKYVLKITSNAIKLFTIALLSIVFILSVNHYYQVKDYSVSLLKNLNVIVFFNSNMQDNESIKSELEISDLVSVKEYVNAADAYSKAIEKNPFLKSISVPDDAKSIQPYAVVTPKNVPYEDFLLEMRSSLEAVKDVDEIIFDISAFKHYVEIKNLLSFYHKVFFIFAVIIFALFIVKCVCEIVNQESGLRILIKDIFSYLMASSFGFIALWSICLYFQHMLFIEDKAILFVVFLAATFGVIFNTSTTSRS